MLLVLCLLLGLSVDTPMDVSLVSVSNTDQPVIWQMNKSANEQVMAMVDVPKLEQFKQKGQLPAEVYCGTTVNPNGKKFRWFMYIKDKDSMSRPYHYGPELDIDEKTPNAVKIDAPVQFHVSVKGPYACDIALGPNDSILTIAPCAWRQAQLNIGRRIPMFAQKVYQVKMQKVALVKHIRSPEKNRVALGVTNGKIIKIVNTGNPAEDFDSLVHEYQHYILAALVDSNKMYFWTMYIMDMWTDGAPTIWGKEVLVSKRHLNLPE